MRLTPLDIRKQEFSRGLRGFDADEVTAFLQMVANQWEELQDENRRRTERIRELEGKLVHYEKVEEALQEALQTARSSSRKTLENAEQKAAIMIDQAEARAEEIKREAERERHDLKRETVKLSSRRSEIVTRLRAFLMSEMELLARYEGDDPVGFIKLVPAEENRLRRLAERLEKEDAAAAEPPADRSGHRETGPQDQAAEEAEVAYQVGARDAEAEGPFGAWSDEQPLREAASEERAPHSADESTRHGPSDDPVRGEGPTEPPQAAPDSERYWSSEPAEDRPDEEPVRTPDGVPSSPQGADRDDVVEGRGWTSRTVVSRPSEQQDAHSSRAERPHAGEHEPDKQEQTDTRTSSEEIEKIRRILSDLE